MKYNITGQLKALPDLDPNFSGEQSLVNEYYPKAILVEVCRTLNENNQPIAPKNVKKFESRKFRLYSIKDHMPNLASTNVIKNYEDITINVDPSDPEHTGLAEIGFINTRNSFEIKSVENIKDCDYIETNSLDADKLTSDTVNVENFTTSEISSIIGIIDTLNGIDLSYKNAQIDKLIAPEISAETCQFNNTVIVNNDIIVERLEIENIIEHTNYQDSLLDANILKTNLKNISNTFELNNSVNHDGSDNGIVVGFVGNGEISCQTRLVDYNNVSNSIGSIAYKNGSLINRVDASRIYYNPDTETSEEFVVPIVSIGKTKLKYTGTINKFDRLELSSTNGYVQKHETTSTNKVIGIALETPAPTTDLVESVVLFDI